MNSIHIIGTGPGDSELLTIKAARILENADEIFFPESNGKSTALDIVKDYINKNARTTALFFPMLKDKLLFEENGKNNANIIINSLSQGKKCAFITLGDPAFYSTFFYLKAHIESAGFSLEIIPGISSFSAGIATASEILAIGSERVAIIPYLKHNNDLYDYIDKFECVVLMKVFKVFDAVLEVMKQKNAVEKSVLICNLGLQDEKILKGKEITKISSNELTYFTTLIIKKD